MSDILLLGTGAFAARIACDIGATARKPVHVVVAGRNAARLDWVRTAAAARAAIFGTPARFTTEAVDLLGPGAEALIARTRPTVVVQAASVQPGQVIAQTGNAWSQLVAEGGLSATATFQASLTARIAGVVAGVHPAAQLINCCFPDVVNPLIAAMGLPVTCGAGNVAILANAFAGMLPAGLELKLLAHYQTIAAWRRPAAERGGPTPRVWLDGVEVGDVHGRFAGVRLTTEPALDISGAATVPLMLAMVAGAAWSGHVPGPLGLPGGYPVRWSGHALDLDLPPGVSRGEAVAWNERFEAENGLVLRGTRVGYTGRLRECLDALSPGLAGGFEIAELAEAHREWEALRTRLLAAPAEVGQGAASVGVSPLPPPHARA